MPTIIPLARGGTDKRTNHRSRPGGASCRPFLTPPLPKCPTLRTNVAMKTLRRPGTKVRAAMGSPPGARGGKGKRRRISEDQNVSVRI